MTPKQGAILALKIKKPDYVPTTELDFQLTEELFKERYFDSTNSASSNKSIKDMIEHNARLLAKVSDFFDYAIIVITLRQVPLMRPNNDKNVLDNKEFLDNVCMMPPLLRKNLNEDRLIFTYGDGTHGVPHGSDLLDYVYSIKDKPKEVKNEASRMVKRVIQYSKRLIDSGFDGFVQTQDYATNAGPFLSPEMFKEFVTPYLFELTEAQRDMGGFVIKHTDGNIIPIIDQLLECSPHAIHSLDPQADMDIKKIKSLYGERVCLIGNVECNLLQTGTKAELLESSEYAMSNGKPGGGYIFSTSNCVFKGAKLENYLLVHEYWKKNKDY